MKITFDKKGVVRKVNKIAQRDDVRKFLANEVYREMKPYTPRDSGILIDTAYTEVGVVIYPQPYAKKVYYGWGGIQIHKNKNQLATTYWDKAMMNAKGGKIAKAVSDYLKRT